MSFPNFVCMTKNTPFFFNFERFCTPKRCTRVQCLVLKNNPNYVNFWTSLIPPLTFECPPPPGLKGTRKWSQNNTAVPAKFNSHSLRLAADEKQNKTKQNKKPKQNKTQKQKQKTTTARKTTTTITTTTTKHFVYFRHCQTHPIQITLRHMNSRFNK